MTRHTVPVFGLWHVVKLASEVIWKRLLSSFIAPAFHALYPKGNVYRKPKVLHMFRFFNLISLVYPLFKVSLENLLAQAKEEGLQTLPHINLVFLLDYAIPLVSCSTYLFSKNLSTDKIY